MANSAYSIIENGCIGVTGKKIAWVGPKQALPEDYRNKCDQILDCKNRFILPGFVDCHTHLVWAGSRSNEFEMRLKGVTYEQIARKGGGIVSTVSATRKAAVETLFDLASKRLEALLKNGITTVEIKTGYGLNLETELKMLDVVNLLNQRFAQHIEATFLGAHTLPPEYKGNRKAYLDLVINKMLPKVKSQGIATAVDVFCENIAFSLDETKQIFKKAIDLGFNVKLHAEQLSDSKGAAIASQFNALSCDHLEYLSFESAQTMAEKNVTAVLLPGAFYFLKEEQKPPIKIFRQLKIPMAVATDLNPGSSPVHSMPLVLNMACILFGMTCEEAILGATINGAKALGLENLKGSIETGKDADFVVWDIQTPADLCYLAGLSPIKMVVIKGAVQYEKNDSHS
ncbi:MAG: imidazolonepropionase [Desulfobacteraceae bacterium]|nr:imidazolonepropionase [Desulfobacteraceae bacterium]